MKDQPTRDGLMAWIERRGWDLREFKNRTLKLLTAKFDIWAKRGCYVVWEQNDLRAYGHWLFNYAQAWLSAAKNTGHDAILAELRVQLIEHLEHWKAVARRYLRQHLRTSAKQAEAPWAQNSDKTAQSAESKSSGFVSLPTSWYELRKRNSITQRQAAQFLNCDPRTVRRLVRANELKTSRKGRIVCSEHLRNQIRKVHGDHVLP